MFDEAWRIVLGWVLGVTGSLVTAMPGWLRKGKRNKVLRELASLYAQGIALRNEGLNLTMTDVPMAWQNKWRNWHSEMIGKAREVSVPRASKIDPIGTYMRLGFPGLLFPQLQDDLSELTETLSRLSEFLIQSASD